MLQTQINNKYMCIRPCYLCLIKGEDFLKVFSEEEMAALWRKYPQMILLTREQWKVSGTCVWAVTSDGHW